MAEPGKLNSTELVAKAQEVGFLHAHRDMGDAVLLGLVTTDARKKKLPVLTANLNRLRIMKYIRRHWDQVQPLLTCPAQSGVPTACFACTDLQVTFCAETNSSINTKATEEDINMAIDTKFQPRTKEEWTEIAGSQEPQQKSLLVKALVHFGMQAAAVGKLSPEERVAYVVRMQEEKGLTPPGAKKGKPTPAAGAAKGAPAKPTPAKGAAKKVEPEPEPEEEEEPEETDSSEEIAALTEKVEELSAAVTSLTELVESLKPFLLEAHAAAVTACTYVGGDTEAMASSYETLALGNA